MKVIILAGGGGSRLFPLSRTLFPKQFLKLNGEESLFVQTIARFLPLFKPSDMVVVTNQEYVHLVQTELIVSNAQGAHILLEPVARNTAPSVAFAARYCLEQLGCEPDEILYVAPSDQIIRPLETFAINVRQAIELANMGKFVTFDVQPNQKTAETDEHTTVYRPWGFYKVLNSGPGYKMKKIVVNPGEILSLQMHYHRSEYWIVIGGTAKVTIGDIEQMVHENEEVFVPQTTKHRIENPGKLPLQIIEVQNGSYLGEDDIVRFNDRYGRV